MLVATSLERSAGMKIIAHFQTHIDGPQAFRLPFSGGNPVLQPMPHPLYPTLGLYAAHKTKFRLHLVYELAKR